MYIMSALCFIGGWVYQPVHINGYLMSLECIVYLKIINSFSYQWCVFVGVLANISTKLLIKSRCFVAFLYCHRSDKGKWVQSRAPLVKVGSDRVLVEIWKDSNEAVKKISSLKKYRWGTNPVLPPFSGYYRWWLSIFAVINAPCHQLVYIRWDNKWS